MCADRPCSVEASRSLTPAERYVAFQYEQLKDLTKHFLTLIAGTLVLTLSVADKLVVTSTPGAADPVAAAVRTGKWLLGASWVVLVLAFIFAGAGLTAAFFAAIAAREGHVYGRPTNYVSWSRPSYLCVDLAGLLYVVGLLLLVVAGLYRLQAA